MKTFFDIRAMRQGECVLLFLLLISLVLKVAVLLPDEAVNLDGVRYISVAQQFAEGNFREALGVEKMPFYSLLIVGLHWIVGDWVLAGQLISLFALLFALVPLYLLTRGLFNEKVAFWTGLAFALSPILNSHAADLIRDPIFLFFFTWAVYFFWRALTSSRGLFWVLSSLSSVLALLCRIEGVFLFPVFLLVLIVLAISKPEERRPLFRGMVVFVGFPVVLGLVLGGIIILVPGIEFSSINRFGELGACLQAAVNGESFAMYHRLYTQLKSFENPGALGKTGSFGETARHYLPLIYFVSVAEALARNLFPLNLIPLFAGFRKRPTFNRGHWLLLLLAGTYFLVAYYRLFTYDFISKRYVLVPALLLFPWVGLGLERIREWIAGCPWPRIALVFFLLVFCGFPAYKSLRDITRPWKGQVIIEAGQWLARQPDLQYALIACSDPRIRFYSPPEMKFLKRMEESFHVAKDFKMMEVVAFDGNADLLIIEISQKKRHLVPDLHHFSLLKEFVGIKNDVLIYSRKI